MVRFVLILCVSLGAIALFLLATATANAALFAEQYPWLLALNGAVALMLCALVVYQLLTLRRKLRAGVFGAKLTLRLVVLFAAMAVLPGALIYGMSVQFLARSIDSWFQVRVDRALEGGINLGRGALDGLLRDLATRADAMALTLSTRPAEEQPGWLEALRREAGVHEAALYGEGGRILGHSGEERDLLMPPPGADVVRQIRQNRAYRMIESVPERGLYLRAVVPVPLASLVEEPRLLQLLQPVPPQLASDAEAVQAGYREYQELNLSRRGLKRLYGITLTVTVLLALLSAAALAFMLSDRLSAPLGVLVEGTRAVASGDFSQRAAVASRDELGALTQSFNAMTLQLAEARAQAERHQAALIQAKAYLESLLANLSAGVLAFDEELHLRAANRSAGMLLGVDLAPLIGLAAGRWPAVAPGIAELGLVIAGAFGRGAGSAQWEQQVERALHGRTQLLLLRGTRLPRDAEGGCVVVFDDITHLAEAQRTAAWAEVARRLAHEIRNPLTPIQLSAERLALKLGGKLAAADAEVLARSTRTIVNQVAALKNMVDAFSQYARTPEPSMRELDLNALAREVLTLYESSLGGIVELDLAAGLPPVMGDAAQLRQVIHNLLQNAQDALAGAEAPRITVSTRLEDGMVRLSVSDNGCGFAENVIRRAFEPYVTTKPKGTGLGLAIVRKIVEEHGGAAEIANGAPRGAVVTVRLPEAAQSAARRPPARAQV
jgi:nitrogen fixation/metabolism regulation signal transduction histidine kinase